MLLIGSTTVIHIGYRIAHHCIGILAPIRSHNMVDRVALPHSVFKGLLERLLLGRPQFQHAPQVSVERVPLRDAWKIKLHKGRLEPLYDLFVVEMRMVGKADRAQVP